MSTRQILLIKTSSLGDVVHNLPVIIDIRRALGDVAIDWVVERAFAAIPEMHSKVRNVICCELRQWRRSWFSSATRRAWRAFAAQLRAEHYDFVIDTQGLLKSAILSRVARGRRIGLDWNSSREPLRFFYDTVYNVPWAAHAVERNRRLAALALGYQVEGEPRYGITAEPIVAAWVPRTRYAIFIHSTSQASKLWPEAFWIALGRKLSHLGISSILPWGNAFEKRRAQGLGALIPNAVVAPSMAIPEIASLIAGARFVVGVDTGLTHLAAALGIPVVGVFGATDSRATGVHAPGQAINLGDVGRFPSTSDVIEALRGFALLP